MTEKLQPVRKSNVRKAFDLFVCFAILMTTAAFKEGDTIQTQIVLRGRSSSNFVSSSNIRYRRLPVGTIGRVLSVKNFRRTGNQGVQILLSGPQYNNLPESQRKVWVYNWTRRSNDLKACTDETCSQEAPAMDLATHARTETAQPATAQPEEIRALSERSAAGGFESVDTESAAGTGCVGCQQPLSAPVQPTPAAPSEAPMDSAPISQLASQVSSSRDLTFSGGRPWIARCANIISNDGEIGPYGRTLIAHMTKSKYEVGGRNLFLTSNALTPVCPRFSSMSDSQKLQAWLVMWAALADQESDCTAALPHRRSIVPGYGLFAAERYARDRNWRGTEYAGDITVPEKQIEVAVATMFDTTLIQGQNVNEGGSYWSPLRASSTYIRPAMNRIRECN